MSFLHSSQTPRYQPLSKLQNGKSRVDDKAARKAQEAREERECYRAVDLRDRMRCRVTGVRLALAGDMTKRVHRHHMVTRARGGQHDTRNVVTVSPAVHDDIHVRGVLKLEGNADTRNGLDKLCGVRVMRVVEPGWRCVGMV